MKSTQIIKIINQNFKVSTVLRIEIVQMMYLQHKYLEYQKLLGIAS